MKPVDERLILRNLLVGDFQNLKSREKILLGRAVRLTHTLLCSCSELGLKIQAMRWCRPTLRCQLAIPDNLLAPLLIYARLLVVRLLTYTYSSSRGKKRSLLHAVLCTHTLLFTCVCASQLDNVPYSWYGMVGATTSRNRVATSCTTHTIVVRSFHGGDMCPLCCGAAVLCTHATYFHGLTAPQTRYP